MNPDDPRSPVWGGVKLALLVGIVFGGISALFGWGDFVGNGLKAAAVVYTLLFVIMFPGAVQTISDRTRMSSRVLGETLWETLISVVLVYFAFFRTA